MNSSSSSVEKNADTDHRREDALFLVLIMFFLRWASFIEFRTRVPCHTHPLCLCCITAVLGFPNRVIYRRNGPWTPSISLRGDEIAVKCLIQQHLCAVDMLMIVDILARINRFCVILHLFKCIQANEFFKTAKARAFSLPFRFFPSSQESFFFSLCGSPCTSTGEPHIDGKRYPCAGYFLPKTSDINRTCVGMQPETYIRNHIEPSSGALVTCCDRVHFFCRFFS